MRKSKEQLQLEQKMLVNKTLNNMRSFIAKMEPNVQYFIDKAKEAKAKNIVSQYNNAARMIKATLAQKRRAEEMLLWFEMANQMKEVSEMTGKFFEGMNVVSKEMVKLTPKNKDFAKTLKNIESGMMASNLQANQAEMLMEHAGAIFDSYVTSGDTEMISDAEIDSLISGMLVSEENVKTSVAENAAVTTEQPIGVSLT